MGNRGGTFSELNSAELTEQVYFPYLEKEREGSHVKEAQSDGGGEQGPSGTHPGVAAEGT